LSLPDRQTERAPDRVRRYLDNAATSHPKPPEVAQAVQDFFARVHASAGRGSYGEALECARLLSDCRAALGRLFGAAPGDHVIFTLNGTDALNMAIKAIVPSHTSPSPANQNRTNPSRDREGTDHVVTTVMDHNSVLRPLSALAERDGLSWTAVEVDRRTTRLDPAALEAALRPNTRLVVVNHASNVTGVLQPLADVVEICRRRGVLLLVDAAQSAGHVPINFAASGIDLLACPGHKGLLGPLGTGVLLIRGGVEERMRTYREGGTGSESEQPEQPRELPDRFEAGSHNAVGIAGLLAAVRWILARGVAALREHELALCGDMLERLRGIPGLTTFGPVDAAQRVGVFSVRLEGLDPAELAALLEVEYGLLSRAGLHCAPFAHRAIGTLATGGTTRFSFGAFTTLEDIATLADALTALARRTGA
jgi:cysteine desulfurase / selenocysteine lyase